MLSDWIHLQSSHHVRTRVYHFSPATSHQLDPYNPSNQSL
jgi:hypothetical protein